MKKIKFSIIFGICLVFLLATGVFGKDNIPTVTLPISNLLEVRKDLIRKEGNAFPGGWSKYHADYKIKTWHFLDGEKAKPFDGVLVIPYTSEMCWVEILMRQDQNLESDGWAEKEFQRWNPNTLGFQIFIGSEKLDLLAKDDLRFIYQDSTGTRRDGEVYEYELDKTEKLYTVKIELEFSLPSNPQNITWFSLRIFNENLPDRVDMRWDFRKD